MKKTILGAFIVLAISFPLIPGKTYVYAKENLIVEKPVMVLTHQQNVWLYALEFCESAGIPTAINPNDLDGTPSYGSFQFKPSTFEAYAKKYGLVGVKIGVYEDQRAIVENMINDPKIRWKTQFPGCIAKLGLPPKIPNLK